MDNKEEKKNLIVNQWCCEKRTRNYSERYNIYSNFLFPFAFSFTAF
jgi:hypothetical protein